MIIHPSAFVLHPFRLTSPAVTDPTRCMSAVGPAGAPPPDPSTDPANLEPLRRQIDSLDAEIVELLNRRARIVVDIGRLKQQNKSPIYAPDREKMILEKVR